MRALKEQIIGKYAIINSKDSRLRTLTDNPREAVWYSNTYPNREPINICGDREFYKDEQGLWKQRPIRNRAL